MERSRRRRKRKMPIGRGGVEDPPVVRWFAVR